MDPLDSAISGLISGGFAFHVIADAVAITGTTRSFTPTQKLIKVEGGL